MPDVIVRTADWADATAIVSVKRAAIEELAASVYTPEECAAWAPDDTAHAEFGTALESDTFQVLVAQDGNTIVGYGVLNAAEASIDGLYVRPFWTRNGIATRLLAQLETSAVFAGCATLSAVVSLNAVPFYEQAGYLAQESRFRTIEGVEIEFQHMEKPLATYEPTDAHRV